MTLQEQIVDAWAKTRACVDDPAWIEVNATFTIGVLVGAGFPGSACLVLALAEKVLGPSNEAILSSKEKMGLGE